MDWNSLAGSAADPGARPAHPESGTQGLMPGSPPKARPMPRKTLLTVILIELVLAIGYVEVSYMGPLVSTTIRRAFDPIIQALELATGHRR